MLSKSKQLWSSMAQALPDSIKKVLSNNSSSKIEAIGFYKITQDSVSDIKILKGITIPDKDKVVISLHAEFTTDGDDILVSAVYTTDSTQEGKPTLYVSQIDSINANLKSNPHALVEFKGDSERQLVKLLTRKLIQEI